MSIAAPDDHLLDSPDPDLLFEVTGVEPDRSGKHAILPDTQERATQRVALGDLGGGIVVLTWPGELVAQGRRLYDGDRAQRLLAAADERDWKVELRPHLAYWHARPSNRLYLHPKRTLTAAEYASQWAGPDAAKIGGHHRLTVRDELWPWLVARGYASTRDAELLEAFLKQVRKAKQENVHLRPALALIRRWEREDTDELRRRGNLAKEIRAELSGILSAMDDPPLPAA